jgi:hypothetical protein
VRAWRVVEAQHRISTRKLVDSDAEQQVLEELIDAGKPPLPAEPAFRGLHYLLATPFRYPPLRHGSRFGTRWERGIWYGARAPRSAFAESAYYRLLFLAGTTAELEPIMLDLSLFSADVRTATGVDLRAAPFAEHQAVISSPISYRDSQQLGGDMRRDGVAAFLYRSARDRRGGTNVGVFTPETFARPLPSPPQTWHCVASHDAVEVTKRDVFTRQTLRFPREDFLVDGALPAPAV